MSRAQVVVVVQKERKKLKAFDCLSPTRKLNNFHSFLIDKSSELFSFPFSLAQPASILSPQFSNFIMHTQTDRERKHKENVKSMMLWGKEKERENFILLNRVEVARLLPPNFLLGTGVNNTRIDFNIVAVARPRVKIQ